MKTLGYAVLSGLLFVATNAMGNVEIRTSSPTVTVSDSASFSLSNPPPYTMAADLAFAFSSLYFNVNLGTLDSVTAEFQISIPVFANATSQSVVLAGDSVSVSLSGSATAQVRLLDEILDTDTVTYTDSCQATGDGDGFPDSCSIGDGSSINSTPAAVIMINLTHTFTGTELAQFLINDSVSRMLLDVEIDAIAAGDVSDAVVWARTFGTPQAQAMLTLTYLYTPGSADSDADGASNNVDNCTVIFNPDQYDANGDGIGNACDADITGPGDIEDCIVNFLDVQAFKNAIFSTPGSPTWNPEADVDGSNSVNFADIQVLKNQVFGPPGPSATGCN